MANVEKITEKLNKIYDVLQYYEGLFVEYGHSWSFDEERTRSLLEEGEYFPNSMRRLANACRQVASIADEIAAELSNE